MNVELLKRARYLYWIIATFIKKHLKIILISFFISFILILTLISIYPSFQFFTLSQKEIVGIAQIADLKNLPLEIVTKISNGFFYQNNNGDLIPILIEKWEKSKDGLTYRFFLKKNLFWADGKLFTAWDIDYQFKDIKKKIINDYILEFTLKKPLDIFPTYLTKPLIKENLVGIGGAYRVGKIKFNQGRIVYLSLLPNNKDLSPLVYKFYNTESKMILAYKKGEITQMKIFKKNIADQFINWKNTKIKRVVNYNYVLTLFFNFNNPLIKEKELRQALLSGIQYDKFKEYGEIAKSSYSPLSFYYNPRLKNYYYEREKSQKIIEKIFPATSSAKFTLKTYSDHYDIAESIIEDLNLLNLKTQLNILNYGKPSDFDFFLAFIEIPDDPDQYYFWHSTQKNTNIGDYNNIRIDKLLEDGRSTLNKNERREIYFKIQEIFQNDPPAIFLFYPYYYLIERK